MKKIFSWVAILGIFIIMGLGCDVIFESDDDGGGGGEEESSSITFNVKHIPTSIGSVGVAIFSTNDTTGYPIEYASASKSGDSCNLVIDAKNIPNGTYRVVFYMDTNSTMSMSDIINGNASANIIATNDEQVIDTSSLFVLGEDIIKAADKNDLGFIAIPLTVGSNTNYSMGAVAIASNKLMVVYSMAGDSSLPVYEYDFYTGDFSNATTITMDGYTFYYPDVIGAGNGYFIAFSPMDATDYGVNFAYYSFDNSSIELQTNSGWLDGTLSTAVWDIDIDSNARLYIVGGKQRSDSSLELRVIDYTAGEDNPILSVLSITEASDISDGGNWAAIDIDDSNDDIYIVTCAYGSTSGASVWLTSGSDPSNLTTTSIKANNSTAVRYSSIAVGSSGVFITYVNDSGTAGSDSITLVKVGDSNYYSVASGGTFLHTKVMLSGSKVYVIYYDLGNQKLKLAVASTSDLSSWQTYDVDSIGAYPTDDNSIKDMREDVKLDARLYDSKLYISYCVKDGDNYLVKVAVVPTPGI